MRTQRNAFLASALAFGLLVAAGPALAQSSPSGTMGGATGGTMNSGTTGAQGSTSTTGTLPDNSLAGQRQGAMTGGKTPQTGDQGASPGTSGSSSAPTGALPDNSLAGQRQGVMDGGSVTQGGSGSTTTPQPK
ncbi:hypothetical protein ACIU1J_23550 [Azospirillum doebereinerae]|uniref:hypothetical protein n=1 Tax=Azospirillum doebereinerae TaxID=92933 RepID=UPI001EE5BE53|nr:hypothetical protein [Azospirillum doebereinerae]MCG5238757.1 hypothetical protein [Azospirillum doebereinerae]